MTINPVNLFKDAVAKYPQVKPLYAVLAAIGLLIIVLSLRISADYAVFGIIIVFALLVLVGLAVAATQLSRAIMALPAIVFVWSVLTLSIASISFVFTGYFFNWPRPIRPYQVPQVAEHHTQEPPQSLLSLTDTKPPFQGRVDGNDLVVSEVLATAFGGDDPQDTGSTMSGVNLKTQPGFMGCSLPASVVDLSAFGAPLGSNSRIPWMTIVRVTNVSTNRTFDLPLIDIGPSEKARSGIDLTVAAFRALCADPNVNPYRSIIKVGYRVIAGASFLPNRDANVQSLKLPNIAMERTVLENCKVEIRK